MIIWTCVHLKSLLLINLSIFCVLLFKTDNVKICVYRCCQHKMAIQKLGSFQYLIIRKRFSLKCREACSPFCFSTPSVPIKAVFLQQILSWWRQPLRALEVKSHRTCVADGLCKSMCKERKQQIRKQTSIKMAACLHRRLPIFYPIYISKFSNFSSEMLSNLQETRENIRSCSVESFFFFFFTGSSKNYQENWTISQWWELLDLSALTSSPSWMETSFALALCYKGSDCIESRHRGHCLMATSLAFPSGLQVSKRYELISIF